MTSLAIVKEVITKVANTEIDYQAIRFYIRHNPTHRNDHMATITHKVDHERAT